MFTDIESVKAVVNAAIDAAKPPRPSQLSDICRLTYFDDARQEVQRMVGRRLKYPYKYDPLVVLHILILVQYSLLHASSYFIQFCIAQAQLIGMMVQYEGAGTPVAKEIAGHARLLSKALAEPAQPSNSTKAVSELIKPKVVAFSNPLTAVTKQEGYAPPPWRIPVIQQPPKGEEMKGVVPDVQIKLHPTPDPTPDIIPVPAASVLLMEKETVAMMTFQRDKEGLMAVLSAVDDLANWKSLIRRSPDDLFKALDCVLYCLYWGSTPFLAQCKGKKTVFELLHIYHHDPAVRAHAHRVFDFLQAAKQEEVDKYPLMHHHAVSPSIQSDRRALVGTPGFHSESDINISKAVVMTERQPFARNAYSDVWEGAYRVKTGEVTVAIKVLRTLRIVYPNQISRNLQREFLKWRSLQHKNVSPFYGVVVVDLTVGLVWPFYQTGNVVDYYEETNQAISPMDMLRGIADGVLYLHAKGIVHGNIRCSNVMVSDKGTPRLIDFGIFKIADDVAEPTGYHNASVTSSLRWSAPEILIGDSPVTSKSEKSDVYAFASTCVELITLGVPCRGLNDKQVMKHIAVNGKLPPRPSRKVFPNDWLWRLLTSCWSVQPIDRPNIVAVRRSLDEITEDVPTEPILPRKKTRLRWPRWINRKPQD